MMWLTSRLGRTVLLLSLLFLMLLAVAACGESDTGVTVDEGVLFYDEFVPGETGEWLLEGDESGRATVADGRLLLEVDEANTVQYTTLAERRFTNFDLQVDVTLLAGSPESTYGVLFGLDDDGETFFRFEITGNGLYVVERRAADGSWERFTDGWVASPALQQGLDATNRLRILAAVPTFSFYANDTLLTQVADARYQGGNVGLDAGTFGQTGLRVAFDNVIIRQP